MPTSNCDDFYLPEHILFHILLYLPVKSLLRFKLVCKSWLSFILSWDFGRQHYRLGHCIDYDYEDRIAVMCDFREGFNSDRRFSLIYNGDNFGVDLDLASPAFSGSDYLFDFEMLYLDGIICMYHNTRCTLHPHTQKLENIVYINLWNPTTRKNRALPQPPIPLTLDAVASVGFGYDLKTKDYKVVRIVSVGRGYNIVQSAVEVYSLSSDTWKIIDAAPGNVSLVIDVFNQPYKDGGICFWPAIEFYPSSSYADYICNRLLLWFDFSKEVFGTFRLPFVNQQHVSLLRPFTMRDKIACLHFKQLEREKPDVWMMNEYGVQESWTKLYTIQSFWDVLVSVLNYGESFLIIWKGRLCIYHLATKEIKNLPFPKDDLIRESVLKAIGYKESLVSIEGGGNPLSL